MSLFPYQSQVFLIPSVLDFRYLQILEYLHVPNEISLFLNLNFIYVLYTSHTGSLKVILYKTFIHFLSLPTVLHFLAFLTYQQDLMTTPKPTLRGEKGTLIIFLMNQVPEGTGD